MASLPPRPTSLRVGFIEFSVEFIDNDEWKDRALPDGDGGQCDGAGATITIREVEGLAHIHLQETLLHEVLHACFYSSLLTIEGTLRQQEDIEEHVVGRLSPVLLQTLRDNPELHAFLARP